MYPKPINISNTTKGSSYVTPISGVYVGVVVRVDGSNIYVTIPKISKSRVFGPCKRFTIAPTLNSYVAVSFLDNRLDEPVILGTEFSLMPGPTGPTGPTGATGPVPSLTVVEKTSSYILASTDKDTLIYFNSSSATTLTINTESLSSTGDQVTVTRYGTGSCTIVAGTATLRATPGLILRAQYSAATIIKLTATDYLVSGDVTA